MGLPLEGKTVLVTRAAGQSSPFTDLLTAQGAQVVEMPALAMQPPSTWAPLDAAIAQIERFDWLVLTSANAVTFFLERWAAVSDRPLPPIKIAVVGQKTAAVLGAAGLTADYVPPDFVADALVAHFPTPVPGLKLLFPRVESGGRDVLVKEMTAAGAVVTEVPAYESGCPVSPDAAAIAALQAGRVNIITFASAKTVRHFCQLVAQGLGTNWPNFLATVAIAAIGPQTSAACYELLGRVDVEAQTYTLEGLTAAIAAWASTSSD